MFSKIVCRSTFVFTVGLCLAVLPAVVTQAADNYVVVFKGTKALTTDSMETIVAAGGNVVRRHDGIGVAIVSSDNANFAEQMRQNSAVAEVIVDRKISLSGDFNEVVFEDSGIARNRGLRALPTAQRTSLGGNLVTDPTQGDLYQFQWNLMIMDAESAWATGALGDPDVTVAILDTGIDYLHQELAGRVDLDRSISFVPEVDALVEANFPGANPIADTHNFGSYLAGLISCNAVRTACVAPNSTLVAVRVTDQDHNAIVSAMISGIVYASDIGSDVIVMTFPLFKLDLRIPEEAAMIDALDRAVQYAHSRGAILVSTVGPPGIDLDDADHELVLNMPTETRKAVGITATNPLDGLSDITGFGLDAVDVAAPGGRFIDRVSPFTDSVLSVCSGFSLRNPECQRPTPASPHRYLFAIGVLGATAQAGGVAALIDGLYDGALHANQLKKRLFDSTDDIGDPGFDHFFGHGRLNMYKASQQ